MENKTCASKIVCILLALLLAIMAVPGVRAAATLEVTAFSCSPNEVKINNQFSCTATVQNTGDAAGTLNTATLYPDATNWLENTNYPETTNANINSGASAEVNFNGLKGKKSGENGFSKIMLDDVTDTYVADNAVTLNVVDVVVTTSSSASSAASAADVSVTGQATAGGNADMTLTFSIVSGGCSIGSQLASTTTNNMGDGQTTSHTWTVTMGSSDCAYSISAQATSNPVGTASKTDTASSSITCSDCESGDDDDSSSSSGAGGGAAGGVSASSTQCSDEIDNDGDGLIDLDDPGCESSEDDDENDLVTCAQSWSCGEWGECANSVQKRTCTDVNDCLSKKARSLVDKIIEVSRPAEVRSCSAKGGDQGPTGAGDEGAAEEESIPLEDSLWLVLVIMLVGVIVATIYVKKKPKK